MAFYEAAIFHGDRVSYRKGWLGFSTPAQFPHPKICHFYQPSAWEACARLVLKIIFPLLSVCLLVRLQRAIFFHGCEGRPGYEAKFYCW